MSTAAEASPDPWRPEDTFAARLMLVRKHLELSQEAIAERCGLDGASWGYWERGGSPQKKDSTVFKIANALGVDRDWLMWGGPLASTKWSPCEDEPAGQARLYALGQGRLNGIL